jgi:hypothetical protein
MKIKIIKTLIAILLILGITYSTLRFGLSQENIATPKQDHSHLRIKYVFNGQEENFGSPRYQTDYTKDICDGSLTKSPLHFHDNKTDYLHLHWARMTGGQMLKFYGLNLIGGLDGYMGFKMDKLPTITPVPIYGNHLPQPRKDDKFWIYTGIEGKDEKGILNNEWQFTKRDFEEFKNKSFEEFFGVESQARKDLERYGNLGNNNSNVYNSSQGNPFVKGSKSLILGDFSGTLNLGTITTYAHAGVEHKDLNEEQKHLLELGELANTENLNNQVITQNSSIQSSESSQNSNQTSSQTSQSPKPEIQKEYDPITGEELKSINNFLGDIVIFVQPNEPTNDQIQARFKTMVKLDKSSCGG